MADNRPDIASRAAGALAAVVAGFVTRKALSAGWKKVTGKEPPAHPEDPDVAFLEAVSWAAMMAVAMATARLLATRVATKRMVTAQSAPAESPESPE